MRKKPGPKPKPVLPEAALVDFGRMTRQEFETHEGRIIVEVRMDKSRDWQPVALRLLAQTITAFTERLQHRGG
ncbi:MAG TPA: hypothetical protein VM537_07095 [Anaerolineae bacterium]|nr:hypothetical protein [Anaerolineae bacterium]